MGIDAKVIAHSIGPNGIELTTLQLRYHRFIHGEFMTHRVFSRNAMSSRAIPVKKMLSQVWNDPATPTHWGANQPGMKARKELKGWKKYVAQKLWKYAGRAACIFAWGLMKAGMHKQIANRILEPWQFIHVVVTATEWDNFFELRKHPDAQPEMQELAQAMYEAMIRSAPEYLKRGEWHLPYISKEERKQYPIDELLKMSAARTARVSYLTHDNAKPSHEKDVKLHDDLVDSVPIHASPTEHQAEATTSIEFMKNFRGWMQYRCLVEEKIKASKDVKRKEELCH